MMDEALIMLGLVTAVLWAYALVSVLAYALVFRKAWRGDRFFLSTVWPYSLPLTLVLWVRHRIRSRSMPKAKVRR